MNNKLSLSDIAALLSERSGKDKKATEQFLREFIQVVSAGLFTDKMVKIKGLGTFKIIPVEERKSIHVHTGERFVIPAHYKYSFLPDKELRDTVNAPFAFFETTEIGNDVDFSDLEESEETEALAEDESVEDVLPEEILPGNEMEPALEEVLPDIALTEGNDPQPGSAVRENEPATESYSNTGLQAEIRGNEKESEAVLQPETVYPEEIRLSQETISTEVIEKEGLYENIEKDYRENPPVALSDENPLLPDAAKTVANEYSTESLSLPEYERTGPKSSDQEKWTKKSGIIIKIVFPILLLVIAFIYLGSLFYEWHTGSSGNTVTLAQIQETQTVNPDGYTDTHGMPPTCEDGNQIGQNTPTIMPADTDSSAVAVPVPLPATRENTPQAQKPVVGKPIKIIDKVKIGAGDRLTLISLKYYGHKFFWVYLYEANKDIIKNPNNVPVGTMIKIPAPEMYGIDAHDKASIAKAAALQAKIIEGKD